MPLTPNERTMLVLSLFPGIGLLDMAFEEEGFCVVRGPDLLWGGDIQMFKPPAGVFTGIIGGPPCQRFSRLAHLVKSLYGEDRLAPNLIPEFERCIREAQPDWFLMENVPDAPQPTVDWYHVSPQLIRDVWVGGATSRERRFTFGCRRAVDFRIPTLALHSPDPEHTVCATSGGRRASVKVGGSGKVKKTWSGGKLPHKTTRPISVMCELQGLPRDFLDGTPFTLEGKRIMIGNGVPLAMGRAVAQAVKRAIAPQEVAA